jgi:hypothetical protein
MISVTVRIEGRDRKVGAMVKALAFEVGVRKARWSDFTRALILLHPETCVAWRLLSP